MLFLLLSLQLYNNEIYFTVFEKRPRKESSLINQRNQLSVENWNLIEFQIIHRQLFFIPIETPSIFFFFSLEIDSTMIFFITEIILLTCFSCSCSRRHCCRRCRCVRFNQSFIKERWKRTNTYVVQKQV